MHCQCDTFVGRPCHGKEATTVVWSGSGCLGGPTPPSVIYERVLRRNAAFPSVAVVNHTCGATDGYKSSESKDYLYQYADNTKICINNLFIIADNQAVME